MIVLVYFRDGHIESFQNVDSLTAITRWDRELTLDGITTIVVRDVAKIEVVL